MNEKRHFWLGIGLMCVWQASAPAGPTSGLEVISQLHHVWGYAGSTEMWAPGGTRTDYDQTSSSPLYVSVTGTYMDPPFGQHTLTASSRTEYFEAGSSADYWFSFANAQSEYTFKPEIGVEALAFHVEGGGYGLPDESNLRFRLDDLTAGRRMMLLIGTMDPEGPYFDMLWDFEWSGRFGVDPTHIYHVTLYTSAGAGDSGRGASVDVTVRPTTLPVPGPVPAPGAFLLGLLGVGFVGRLRRRGVL